MELLNQIEPLDAIDESEKSLEVGLIYARQGDDGEPVPIALSLRILSDGRELGRYNMQSDEVMDMVSALIHGRNEIERTFSVKKPLREITN